MDTVTDANMIIKMSEFGGTGILHRFYSDFEYHKELSKLREKKIFSTHKDYKDERFNDNYNTQPNETISLRFSMDYLGFFGYEQKSNLFFEEPGSFNYGL